MDFIKITAQSGVDAGARLVQQGKDLANEVFTNSEATLYSNSFNNIINEDIESTEHESWLVSFWRRVRRTWRYVMLESRKFPLYVLLALFSAILSLTTQSTHDALFSQREKWEKTSPLGSFLTGLLFNCTCVLIAASLALLSPYIAGSGIPFIKGILAGVPIPGLLTFRVAIGKWLGLLFAMPGLTIGREGTFVVLCSVVGKKLLSLSFFQKLRTGTSESTLPLTVTATAVASGLGSLFRTPIGGVLFATELSESYSFRIAGSDYFSCFIVALFSSLFFGLLELIFPLGTGASLRTDFDIIDFSWSLILFALLGLLLGLLSALFVRLTNLFLVLQRVVVGRGGLWRRFALVLTVVALTTLMHEISVWGSFDDTESMSVLFSIMPLQDAISDLRSVSVSSLAMDSNTTSYFNLSGELLKSDDITLPPLLSLMMYVPLFFLSATMAAAMPVPTGSFGPLLVIGAAVGRSVGELAHSMSGDIPAGSFAVAGAAAMASGTTMTLSTVVILFELTGQVALLLPCLLCSVVAYLVSGTFSVGIYDMFMKGAGLPSVGEDSSNYPIMTVGEVMHLLGSVSASGPQTVDPLSETTLINTRVPGNQSTQTGPSNRSSALGNRVPSCVPASLREKRASPIDHIPFLTLHSTVDDVRRVLCVLRRASLNTGERLRSLPSTTAAGATYTRLEDAPLVPVPPFLALLESVPVMKSNEDRRVVALASRRQMERAVFVAALRAAEVAPRLCPRHTLSSIYAPPSASSSSSSSSSLPQPTPETIVIDDGEEETPRDRHSRARPTGGDVSSSTVPNDESSGSDRWLQERWDFGDFDALGNAISLHDASDDEERVSPLGSVQVPPFSSPLASGAFADAGRSSGGVNSSLVRRFVSQSGQRARRALKKMRSAMRSEVELPEPRLYLNPNIFPPSVLKMKLKWVPKNALQNPVSIKNMVEEAGVNCLDNALPIAIEFAPLTLDSNVGVTKALHLCTHGTAREFVIVQDIDNANIAVGMVTMEDLWDRKRLGLAS